MEYYLYKQRGYPSKTVWHFHYKEVIFMGNEYILLLLKLIDKGVVTSITVTKDIVTVRIKK